MEKLPIPDTIGVSMDTRESLRKASQNLTAIEIPGYELLREIGRGNFGTVWQAERKKTGQQVAIKVVDNETDINWTYFRRELDFLRELEEHPHTLTILDARLDSEPPYIVMPLADGGSLEEAVRRKTPDPQMVETWLWQMAEALVFIHRKGIIHCDFKPSNVLLSSDQHIRIADLGQARRVGHGMALGTIGFMAPEQCVEKANPSVGWDVYGFGATAYWLLTGRVPRSSDRPPANLDEYVANLAKHPLIPVRVLNPKVDREFAAIIEHCLQLDPKSRYPSLDGVLSDLQRRRKNEPLLCKKPWGLLYLVRVALRRREVQIGLFLLVLACAAAAYGWQARNYNRYLTQLTAGIHAHESGRFEEAYLHWLEAFHYRPLDRTLAERFQFMPIAQVYPHKSRVTDVELADNGNLLVSSSTDGTVNLWDTTNGKLVRALAHPSYVAKVAVSPRNRWLATASWDGFCRIFDLSNGKLQWQVSHQEGEFPPSMTNIEFVSDGKYLATADLQGVVRIWLTQSGQEHPVEGLPQAKAIRQVLVSHPHKPLLGALLDSNTIGLWDLENRRSVEVDFRHHDEINDIEISPNGRYLISASDDTDATVWDLESKKRVRSFPHDTRINRVLALPDDIFVAGCEDGSVSVWKLGEEEPLRQFFHRRPVRSLRADQEGTLLAVGTGESEHLWSDTEANGTVEVWHLRDGYQVGGPWPHDGPVEGVAFQSARNQVFSASGSARQTTAFHPGSVRAWRVDLPELLTQVKSMPTALKPLTELEFSNGVVLTHGENISINSHDTYAPGKLVATASEDRTVRVWSSTDGSEARIPILLDGPAKAVAFSPDGERVATSAVLSASQSVVQVWELQTSYPITPKLSCPGVVYALEWSPEDSSLHAYTDKGKYRWILRNGKDEAAWEAEVHQRLRAELDKRGSVIPIEIDVSNGQG